MSVLDRPDHTGTIYVSGSVTIPISIESSVVTFDVAITSCTVTLSVNITDSDIMMPVDIQAQYLTLDINIAASAVTLNVNITASAVTLNIAIQSSAVTLNVNITNATIAVTGNVTITGTANITITAQTVGVSIQGEWQVEHDNFKSYAQNVGSIAPTNTTTLGYTVPAGKVLYIYGAAWATMSDVAGSDNPQECDFWAQIGTTDLFYGAVGEAQQCVIFELAAPIKVSAGQTYYMRAYNRGTANARVSESWHGYERNVPDT